MYVNQDGVQYNAPAVFDKLIAEKAMPVTIGVFVMHGRVQGRRTTTPSTAFNRSYEYDGLGDDYARFLLDELLPDVEKKTTADGRAIKLSKNGNDRAIGGRRAAARSARSPRRGSGRTPSRRVFSAIGTYVGLRGGNDYPTLIRKFEPKPIRVFLQDGEQRPEHLRRRLVDGEPGDGAGADVRRVRGEARLGRGRAQRQARDARSSPTR